MSWKMILEYEYLLELGISIGVFFIFLLFRKIFSKYVFTLLLKISRKAPKDFLSHVFLSFEKPVQWLFIVIGIHIAAQYYPGFDVSNLLYQKVMSSSIIILLAWGLFNLSSASSLMLTRMNKKYNAEIDEILIPFLSNAIRVVIVAITISIVAEKFGYNVSGFVAGLGLGGLAISLAAKDALANFFGGIVIITEKPFSIGDWIKTSSIEGTVEEITFRSTKVRTFQDALVTVPNATLANDAITNFSKMNKRQITFTLKVSHGKTKEQLKRVVEQIEDMLKNHPDVHKETIYCTFNQYQDNGFEIFLYFFTETTKWGEYLKVKEDINFKILEILEKEGIYESSESKKPSPNSP